MRGGTTAKASVTGLMALGLAACADVADPPRSLAGADVARGRRLVERMACAACHEIPGVPWPKGRVGGALDGVGARPLIAGRFPNQPETLARWVRNAPSLDPSTGMPPIPLTQAEARDVTAYLYTLR